jgi:hypothetical protein
LKFVTRLLGSMAMAVVVSACSGAPDISTKPDGVTVPKPGDEDAGAAGDTGGPDPIIKPGENGSDGGTCKKTCADDECGPIADGCGDLINCGGCDAPATCGGGGEPSRCGGEAACTPTSCEQLGATCGEQPDGCGGVLDCWSNAAKQNGNACTGDGEQCIDGDCQVPPTSCDKKTCSDYDGDGLCGPVSDGCGGTLECGFECASDEICGAASPGECGKATCTPESCESALARLGDGFCGFVPDGCGGEIEDCSEVCTGGDTCGGGGTPDVCGQGSTEECVPRTLADCGTTCGPISDGCGDVVECGGCTDPDTCGGGGVPGECGSPACEPWTCADFSANCGSISDGCGGTVDCDVGGGCDSDEACNANQCQGIVCEPLTQAEACTGFCGFQSDGCGGQHDCGGCTAPNSCGGGGTPSVCGAPPCTPLTCADVGANCGPIGDGCGGVVESCGDCTGSEICGGGGTPSVCGTNVSGTCTGLCQNQVSCPVGNETRLTGTVYAPNGSQPLYNALVYVPNAPLPAIAAGPACGRCEDEELGEPIAAAITGADGTFVLKNVPAGVDFPLVVKMGKWRRVVTIPAQTQCTNVDLTVDQTRLPRHMNDATPGNKAYLNIPQMAVATGDADAMECVLRKIGVDDVEFTLPSSTGRIHLYRANGAYAGCSEYRSNGTCRTKSSASLSSLFSGTNLNKYDIAIFDCEGAANDHDSYDAKLHAFADAGGRVFASHYSYTYLRDNDDFAGTATWGGPQAGSSSFTTGIVDTSSSKGQAFNAWLGYTNSYSTTYGNGYIDIEDPRYYVQANDATNSERFVYTDTSVVLSGTTIDEINATEQYAFNTPVGAGADDVCGRVLYSAFHVAVGGSTNNAIFPAHCSTGPLTAQEKVLEFMLFDLSACVSVGDPGIPTCTAKTCEDLGATCGYRADGCGKLLNCGTCGAPDTCGGGGTPDQCGHSCPLTTCGAEGANCGVIADGCGGALDCGDCTAPAICGGGGTANVCGTPACTPRSCASVGATCGPISDGCGNTVDCGTCSSGLTCGGGGTPNQCGTGSCNPKTCMSEGAECGFVGDGCGGTVSCGSCPNGQTCGAGGPNVCGGGCVKRTCGDVSANCGFVGDGCGGVLDCGDCTPPSVCGGGGTPSQCGGSCVPRTCTSAGATCGAISDGCGGVLSCGTCPAGKVCGAGGTPNQCGNGSCTPKTCTQAGAECGAVGDGCGNIIMCGTCTAPESCGGAGVPNQCGTGGCIPLTCAQQGAECGPAADGCGGLLDCGTCSTGTCGGGGVASKCGSIK